ncbi:MAG: hypothetical protein V3T83_22730, partial [Acidobacteriota bacterium]
MSKTNRAPSLKDNRAGSSPQSLLPYSLTALQPLLLALLLSATLLQAASSRIKDVASFQGVRGNMLMGQGLVV